MVKMKWTIGKPGGGGAVMIADLRRITIVDRGHEREAVFALPSDLSWQQPEALGEAVRAWMQQQPIRGETIGAVAVTSGWVALRQTTLPPADDPRLLPGMVEFAADDLYAERLDELALAWQISPQREGVEASIFALHRRRLGQMQQVCAALGARVSRIVPLAAVMAQALKLPPTCVLIVQHGCEAEVAVTAGQRITWLGSVAVSDQDHAATDAALQALVLTMPTEARRPIVAVADPWLAAAAGRVLGAEVVPALWQDGEAAPGRPIEAAATAVRQARHGAMNYLQRRAAERGRDWHLIGKRAAVAAAIVLLIGGYVGYDWWRAEARIDAARKQLASMANEAAAVQQWQKLNRATDPWFDTHPRALPALRALTEQFPAEGTVWLTSCEVEEGGQITMVGKARSRSVVLDLLGKLETCGKFDRLAPAYVRQQSAGDGLVTFAATCRYRPGGGA